MQLLCMANNKIVKLEYQTVITLNKYISIAFQFDSMPQKLKPAPVPAQIEQKVEMKSVKTEEVEPQPVEHKV